MLAASWGGVTYPWTSAPLAGVAAVGLVAFVLRERRTSEPVLPMTIFADRNLTLAAVTGAIMFGCVLYLPLFQQTIQHA